MFNPYQAQGHGFNQQPLGNYPGNNQPPTQLTQRPTSEFGNYQQNVPSSFGLQQQPSQQQQQQQHQHQHQMTGFVSNGSSFGGPNAFGGAQGGFQGGQQTEAFSGSTAIQPQQTNFYSQQNTLQPQLTGAYGQQVPPTSFFGQQVQPQSSNQQQQQPTGTYQQPMAVQQSNLQPFQQTNYSSQPPQTTGYMAQQQLQGTDYNQPRPTSNSQANQPSQTGALPQTSQPLQPQQTGYYSQPSQQPLQPQQTGFYSQNAQPPMQPLKPSATGFVNSFANNGVNDDMKIPAMRLSFMTANDQAKFETLFRSSVPRGSNTISGNSCRSILMKSGVSPTLLARIWTLCDTSRAGELLFPEFALAMHLVNDVIQGDSVPFELSTKMKNEVASFVDAINFSIASGDESSAPPQPKTPFDDLTSGFQNLQPQPTGMMPNTSFGMPLQSQTTQGQLNPQLTGFIPQTSFNQALTAQATGGLLQSQPTGGYSQQQQQQQQQPTASFPQQQTGNILQSQSTGGFLQPQSTGFMPQTSFNQPLQSQFTGINNFQPQTTGLPNSLTSVLTGQPTGQFPGQFPETSFNGSATLQPQPTGYLPPSNFNPTAPLTAQKTGFGNNEIYSQANFAKKFMVDDSDVISSDEKALFYKIFDTYDSQGHGLMGSATAVEVFRKSGLNRNDLEQIWNLCDINNSGQLNRQEFALGMHLVYRRLKGHELPNRLPPSLIPSSNQILNSVKDQLKNSSGSERKEPTKVDGISFKHNDDELLPSSRNRRKTYQSPSATGSELTSASIEPSNTRASQTPKEPASVNTMRPRVSDERAIEDWKRKILALPQPSSVIKQDAGGAPAELEEKFAALTSRVPQLLAEISNVNNQITMAKIELYRQRNPSSMVGTGKNGEVTEEDRRKAKSKALLASRMATLMGKQPASANVEQQEQVFNEEVAKFRSENSANQSIIEDIQTSIFEIAASVKSALGGKKNISGRQYEMWELGIGVDSHVSAFISKLHPSPSVKKNSEVKHIYRATAPSSSSSSNFQQRTSSSLDRSTFLKEQAQRKMKERLASLSLGEDIREKNSHAFHAEELDINEEDEEVRKLTEQLAALKAKKKDQSGAAETRQIYEPKAESRDQSPHKEVSASEQINTTQGPIHDTKHQTAAAPALKIVQQTDELPQLDSASPISRSASNHHKGNPFGMPQRQSSSSVRPLSSTSTGTGERNPFFKPTQSGSPSFDAKAAEAQRRIQRGLDDDDDWSDAEDSSKTTINAPAPVAPAPVAPAPAAPAPVAPAPVAPAPVAPAPAAPAPVAPAPIASAPIAPAPVAPAPVAPAPVAPAPVAPAPVAPAPVAPAPVAPAPVAPAEGSQLSESARMPPVPTAPPLPQLVNNSGPTVNSAPSKEDESDENFDDNLSIPESVDSFNDAHSLPDAPLPPSGIPPPPPLP
ncbi:LADA_0E13630g1_1 [Lachancea dasiensis]|uniref:Actin cytoskeleton-regulatory complex protein PAN1 n=1 Tax=Lachancea dasiensis TaxID=1072105 RepID=A0A1G4JFL3_9SACH|nr:LADA_0E13630g1_1 [Lachancea dasiensis]